MRLHPDIKDPRIRKGYKNLLTNIAILNLEINYSYKFTTYRGVKHKIFIYCKQCKSLFKQRVDTHIAGHGCPKCASIIKISALQRHNGSPKKSETQYIKELREKNPTITLVDSYIDTSTPVRHLCNNCGFISKSRPKDKLKGFKCKHCTKKGLEHLLNEPAKLYTFKITKGKAVAYKIGVTTQLNILGSNGRYHLREDLDSISDVKYIEYTTLQEALEIERHYKYHSNNVKYRGKKQMLKDMGKTELFKNPIDIMSFK